VTEHGLLTTSIQPETNQREETAMLKFDTEDYRSEPVHDLLEDYPKEVLESEWNPVIAQMQLLKRHRQETQPQPVALCLSILDAPFEDR
jgi:hypothetical protein